MTGLGQSKSNNTIAMQLRFEHVTLELLSCAFRETIMLTNYSIQALDCLVRGCNFSPLD